MESASRGFAARRSLCRSDRTETGVLGLRNLGGPGMRSVCNGRQSRASSVSTDLDDAGLPASSSLEESLYAPSISTSLGEVETGWHRSTAWAASDTAWLVRPA